MESREGRSGSAGGPASISWPSDSVDDRGSTVVADGVVDLDKTGWVGLKCGPATAGANDMEDDLGRGRGVDGDTDTGGDTDEFARDA